MRHGAYKATEEQPPRKPGDGLGRLGVGEADMSCAHIELQSAFYPVSKVSTAFLNPHSHLTAAFMKCE